MRYNQIITEFLDMNVYGSWLNVKTGQTYPIVQPMGHSRWLRAHMHDISELQPFATETEEKLNSLTPEQIDDFEDERILYDMAYKAGFIKTMHPTTYNDFNIVLGGTKTDLARSLKYIWGDIRHAVGKLYLYVYNGLDANETEKTFKLPNDLAAVRSYINN